MAKYSRRKASLDDEKNICAGVIVSDHFCRDFKLLIGDDLELIKSKYLRTIINWSLQYYAKYDKAPQESIVEVFKAERKNLQNEDDVDLIEDTIEEVNEKYIENELSFDNNYIYNQIEKYIRGRALEENADMVKGLVSQGKISEAEGTHKDFKRKTKNDVVGVSILEDMEAIDDAFVTENSVFSIPGALGELMGDIFPGDLCYIGGPSKASKTWTSMELALMCVNEGLNVGWWSLEMSSKLMLKRFAQNIGGGSFKKVSEKAYVPYFNKHNNIKFRKEKIPQLTEGKVKRKFKLLQSQSGNGKLMVYDGTTSGNTVEAIKNTIINAEEYEGIKFDVIFIDQLNLIKTFGVREKRHQLDNIALEIKREIAQDLNLLVFSPVQYNRDSIKNDTNDESSISEAYSLFSHASLLISLNQNKEERERGLMRITCSGRHSRYSGVVLVLQCLDKGRAIMDSRWIRDVANYNDVVLNSDFNEEDEEDLLDKEKISLGDV
jgi:replicative DNA helicase